MSGLVQEVKDANQRLLDALHVSSAKHNVQQEVKQLNDSIVAAHRFIDSCCYLPDAEVNVQRHQFASLVDIASVEFHVMVAAAQRLWPEHIRLGRIAVQS